MSLLQNSNAISAGGAYNITDSLRFRSSASAYLSRTPTTAGNRRTWTLSAWIKRGLLTQGQIFTAGTTGSTNHSSFFYNSASQAFQLNIVSANTNKIVCSTSAIFRDPSAWYHIVLSVDTTQATNSDGVKLYVNGVQQTLTFTTYTQNEETQYNNTSVHNFGLLSGYAAEYYDGYMTEVNFVDGQALTASDFGETNDNGVWSPKKYTGTYGTNGFYLPMKETTQATGFNTVLYKGNSGTQSVTGVGFSPDLVWIKSRSNNYAHGLYDTLRGANTFLTSQSTSGDITNDPDGYLSAFNSDGFTLSAGSTSSLTFNSSIENYVAWCWDAGSSTVSNTDGTITSSVRANPASGFSIVTFTGNATAGATVGHGLGSAPKMVIYKARNNGNDWWTYHAGLTSAAYAIQLNTTNGENNTVNFFNSTAPDSSVLTLGYWNNATGFNLSTQNYVAYCFSEVAGFSKFGSYVGNGSADGPTVTTGFRPAFVMVKRTTSGTDWEVHDSTRNPYNLTDLTLRPNSSSAEFVYATMDFLSNGFKLKDNSVTSNSSGDTFIYMAFADTRDFQWNFDASGNKNNWIPNNINSNASSETTYDLMSDVPFPVDEDTGNFPTWNPLKVYSNNLTISNGNLTATDTSSSITSRIASMALPTTGKWYFEITATTISASLGMVGVIDSTVAFGTSSFQNKGQYRSGGQIYNLAGTAQTSGSTYTSGDVIGVAVDVDAGNVQFYKNNVAQGGTPSFTFTAGTELYPCVSTDNTAGTKTFDANFGQIPFKYTPPTGYKKLNTYNLPDSSITDGSQYMNPVLYTGNGTSQSITGLGFSPDLVWVKSRNTASYWHNLVDTVRGNTKYLFSNDTTGETTQTTYLTSFDSDGFSIGSNANWNNSGTAYVAWNWRGSDSTAVSNTDGTITSTVSANTTSGFSVVTYTGNGVANASFGHGLGVTPDFVLVKNRSNTSNWRVQAYSTLGAAFLNLNGTQAADSAQYNQVWGATPPTSSVIHIGGSADVTQTNANGNNYVAYCFANVEGFSKIGKYTGNGSADGPFVYTGFRPAFIMCKRTNNTGDWVINDTSRNPNNVANLWLYANLANADTTFAFCDIISNGFKIRVGPTALNNSGDSYIFMAFAENPFKNSLAR